MRASSASKSQIVEATYLATAMDALGKITKVDYRSERNGDSTILEFSTVLEGSEIHPVQQYHGSLFVDNDVKMRLKVELTRPFSS